MFSFILLPLSSWLFLSGWLGSIVLPPPVVNPPIQSINSDPMSQKRVSPGSPMPLSLSQRILACLCPCLGFKIFETLQMNEQPSACHTEESHSTLPAEQPTRSLVNELQPSLTITEGNSLRQCPSKQSGINIRIHEEEGESEGSEAEDMQRQYEQYLSKGKQPTVKQYAVDSHPEGRLVVVGNQRGRMLIKVKRVAIEPSDTAVRKQKEASKSQREGKVEKSTDPVIEKYWDKRYLLFERFDEGIKLDQQSWFSVTPEAVAEHIANRVNGFETVLDAFCGAGGDSLKLAVSCKHVISNDIDPLKISLLVNNAAVYGVDNLQPSVCSFFDLQFKRKELEAVYLAPPWGGPDYHLLTSLKPEDFEPSVALIIQKAVSLSDNLIFLMPVNSDLQAFGACISQAYQQLGTPVGCCSMLVEKIYFHGGFKFLAIYVGSRVSQINLGEELEYVYWLLADGEKNFTHKRVVKKIREDHGMLALLNFVFSSQQAKLKAYTMFDRFLEYLINNQLITRDKLDKLLEIQEDEASRQANGKGQTKRNKSIIKSMREKEKQCKLNVIVPQMRNSLVENNANRASTQQKTEQTVSYISAISDSKLIGTVFSRSLKHEQQPSEGVRIEAVSPQIPKKSSF